jgi:hypothetical protein
MPNMRSPWALVLGVMPAVGFWLTLGRWLLALIRRTYRQIRDLRAWWKQHRTVVLIVGLLAFAFVSAVAPERIGWRVRVLVFLLIGGARLHIWGRRLRTFLDVG